MVCRFCKLSKYDQTKYQLVQYGVRHYAHPDCGLLALGAAFLSRLSSWQLQHFPAQAAADCGLLHELKIRVKVKATSA